MGFRWLFLEDSGLQAGWVELDVVLLLYISCSL